ncbi:hypothetical protein NP233_g10672 [Leucocoprinus birnbaumii]|uniref:(2E,6E)-farnesyl diphosphate synthase n=1 Tax=Leucocoprinus birnbaumii TaxID=56174 RepID=A0AAD5VI94_9AGAR|nr:hypothetical protein NP233_g10672 [Leucocoprinus birnbaumii]
MLTPAVSNDDAATKVGSSSPSPIRNRSASGGSTKQPSPLGPDNLFARKKVLPIKPQQSALSGMLNGGKSSNPFTETYASVSGRSAPASTSVSVYFPHAKRPAGKPMDLTISRDATVEEVIGFALWTFWEEGWLPKLDEGLSGPSDPKWEDRISACGWIMRLAEDDGEVDDDFPPPDRLGKIVKFNADAYAILEATPAQIKQNREIEAKIQRPIKTTKKQPDTKLTLPNLTAPSAIGVPSLLTASWAGQSAPISTSLGPSSSHGPQIFLRVRVDMADAVLVSTTIPVSAGMYMQEALEMVCRRRKLTNPKEYALLLADRSILIPLDRTVASLQGKRELLLVKRSVLPTLGGNIVKGVGRTTDPNASIFKSTDTPEVQYTTPLDFETAYKSNQKYIIYRKMPMLVARQPRTLAVDGEWVHIMPLSNKAKNVFDSGRTSSYHIKTIADCQQSSKSSSTFKLVLTRGGGTTKRYDFEAENPKMASEIVQTIKGLKSSLERSGTLFSTLKSVLTLTIMTDQASPTKMFEQVYDRITSDLVNEWRKEGVPEEAITRYKKSLDYNLLGGKMYRGVTVVNTAQILKRHPLSEDEYLKAAVLGWCVELGHAHGLVTDDIMDESMTRRFRPCWYRNLGIGLTAISDSAIGFWSIHRLLRLYFRKDPYYVDLLELFLESRWQTEIGQLIDLITALEETNTSTFSLERHSTLVIWKTAFYSFYLPVACAMYLCGITRTPVAPLDPSKSAEDPYEVAKSILLLLGEYFQVQDDYLDFAGTPAQIGKIGTDIIDKKMLMVYQYCSTPRHACSTQNAHRALREEA